VTPPGSDNPAERRRAAEAADSAARAAEERRVGDEERKREQLEQKYRDKEARRAKVGGLLTSRMHLTHNA
jgi:hypothetical protein